MVLIETPNNLKSNNFHHVSGSKGSPPRSCTNFFTAPRGVLPLFNHSKIIEKGVVMSTVGQIQIPGNPQNPIRNLTFYLNLIFKNLMVKLS